MKTARLKNKTTMNITKRKVDSVYPPGVKIPPTSQYIVQQRMLDEALEKQQEQELLRQRKEYTILNMIIDRK